MASLRYLLPHFLGLPDPLQGIGPAIDRMDYTVDRGCASAFLDVLVRFCIPGACIGKYRLAVNPKGASQQAWPSPSRRTDRSICLSAACCHVSSDVDPFMGGGVFHSSK